MSVSTVYVLHGIQTPTQFYGQIESATPQPMIAEILGSAGNYHQPLFRGARGLNPQVPFRTSQLATLLAETGLLGVDLSAGNTDLFYRLATNRGNLASAAASSHMRLRIAKGFMFTRQITAGHQREAAADATLLATYDGTNAPIVPAGSLALSGTPTSAEHFSLGPVSINGSVLNGVEDCTIDLGVQLRSRGSASEVFPTFNGVRALNPVITLRGAALEPWTSYGLNGTALTSTGLIVYLRKVNADIAAGLPYVADATAQHIKFTGTLGVVAVGQTDGGDGADSTTEVKVYLRAADASSMALAVATASAIT